MKMVILVNVRVEPYPKSYRKDDFRLLVAYTHRATLKFCANQMRIVIQNSKLGTS